RSLDLTLWRPGVPVIPAVVTRLDDAFIQLPPMHTEFAGVGTLAPTSYRHPGGTMNAAFWDGHVEQLTQVRSLDPALWYPRGTEYTGGARPEVEEEYGYSPGDFVN